MSFSPSLSSAQKAGVVVSAREYPSGAEGLRMSLEEVARQIVIGKDDPGIRELTAKALIEAGVDGRDRPSVLTQISALLKYVVAHTIYAPDPGKTEHIQAAHVTLCVRDMCIPMEDCESLVIALGAMAAVLGLDIYAVKLNYGAGKQQHLVLGVIDEQKMKLYADPSQKGPVTRSSGAAEEEWIDPFDQINTIGTTGAELVTLGQPQEREVYFKKGSWYEFAGGHWWVHANGRWVKGPAENECDRNAKVGLSTTLGPRGRSNPRGHAVSEGTKRGVAAPEARGGRWFLGDVELAPSQWSQYGLGAPPVGLGETLPYQQVTDGQALGGLRYRIGMQVSLNFNPDQQQGLAKTLIVEAFPDFIVESLVTNGPVRQSPDGSFYQPWILQGLARVDTSVKDVHLSPAYAEGDIKILIMGVQASKSSPQVPPAPTPPPPPAKSNDDSNAGILGPVLAAGGIAIGGGVLWHGYKKGWFRRKRAA